MVTTNNATLLLVLLLYCRAIRISLDAVLCEVTAPNIFQISTHHCTYPSEKRKLCLKYMFYFTQGKNSEERKIKQMKIAGLTSFIKISLLSLVMM